MPNNKTATATKTAAKAGTKPVSKVRQFVNDAQATRGKPGRKKLSEDEQKQKDALDAINGQTDVNAAQATWQALQQQVGDLNAKRQQLKDQAREEDRLRSKAATAQDYVAAQTHKEAHTSLTAQAEAILPQLTPLVEQLNAAQAKHTELFLADPSADYNQPESLTVNVIRVIDPSTGAYDTASYLESDHTVQLSLNGKYFESEAYHVGSWATEHGFVVRHKKQDVTV